MTLDHMKAFLFPLFDAPGDGSGSGGAAGSGDGTGQAGAGTGAGAGIGTGDKQAAGSGDGQSRTGAQSGQFTYAEDRSKWIPPHRFGEVNTQAQQFKTRAQELEAAIAERDAKIAALAGVGKTDPEAAKVEQIKEAFFNLPGMEALKRLAELSEEQLESILQVPQHIERTTEAERQAWERHSDTQIGYISDAVAEALGADAIDAEQEQDLRNGLQRWIRARAAQEIETTGKSETITRYEKGDKKLLDEFITSYTKRWVEPARRQSAARTQTRIRPVVQSGARNAPVSSLQRPDKFKSLDERLDFAVGRAKELGVQFGGR